MEGLPVHEFNIGDKVKIANPLLTTQSENKLADLFTVNETQLSFGKWKSAKNDRTGRSYVMGNGEYYLA